MALIVWPESFLITPRVAQVFAALCGVLATIRTAQAVRLLNYQRSISHPSRYTIRSRNIPVSKHKLFLGRGFRWTQKHTQRFYDIGRLENRRYLQPNRLVSWVRRREDKWESARWTRWLSSATRSDSRFNPFRPLPPVGGRPEMHGVEPSDSKVWMDQHDRVGHVLVLGTTRVGKTRLAELLITQDIRRGDVVIVFDPKGDTELLQRVYTESVLAGRQSDFRLFHLGFPDFSCRYNAIGRFSRITEVATRIANQLPGSGNSAAFREFAWRFVNIIARALNELGRVPDYQQIRRYINDIEPLFVEYANVVLERECGGEANALIAKQMLGRTERSLPSSLRGRDPRAVATLKVISDLNVYDPVLEGLESAFKYDRTYFDKIVSSVGPLMEKLTTGPIADLIAVGGNGDGDRQVFDWHTVLTIRERRVVYVGLDALTDSTVASAVGNSMFADLVSLAGEIYKHGTASGGTPWRDPSEPQHPVSLHADEFNELIGDEFIPLLNKAGGAGFQVTAYTQTWSDVIARLGNQAKASQVAGNFNTLITFRVKEMATAKMITDQLPLVAVKSRRTSSGASDSLTPGSEVDFQSHTQDQIASQPVPIVSPSDLMALSRGQAFAVLGGGHLWKLQVPLPDPRDTKSMRSVLDELAA